jgi:N-dimethylarginine dimethylaminohydrolase/TusA-related sulfurtransferase
MAQHSFPNPDTSLDLRGYRCPIPVLKARRHMDSMTAGQTFEMIVDDPVAKIDVPHFCAEAGHFLESMVERNSAVVFVIRKGTKMALNEWGTLRRVAVRRPSAAFANDKKIDAEWRQLNYHSRPDFDGAEKEFAAFEALLKSVGAEVVALPGDASLTLDSLYVRDALMVSPKGVIACRMGKPARESEPTINATALGVEVVGAISASGKLEGGDLVWIDDRTLLVGVGYRTNMEAVAQLRHILGNDVTVCAFDLPHYKGPADVFHLMSVLSPIDRDLAVVHPPLMPVRLVEFLRERGVSFVEVPNAEFPTMGCNVLALAPRHVLLVEGNPQTERGLRDAGVRVEVIAAAEICRKGEGGPTCLTRPLLRG